MKILIAGGLGQLAHDCCLVLREKHELLVPAENELDITDQEAVRGQVGEHRPDIIINCAAYTRVDDCESQREKAWQINALGPEILAIAAEEIGCQLLHISTDYIFNGRKTPPEAYVEDEAPDPLSYYGASKLAGEQAVIKVSENNIIIRTAWLYGSRGHNFFKTILRAALKKPEQALKVVNDQHGSPTWSYRLALQIDRLIEAGAAGTFHATAEGHTTWFEAARFFLEKMAVPHKINPCSTDQYPTPATRPANSILENRHLKNAGLCIMEHWQNDLLMFIEKHGNDLLNECRPTGTTK